MMERFNFYDIYGYLLPGGFWLGLLWLPFVLVAGFPAEATVEIAGVGLFGGYIAGHLLQTLARNLVPNKLVDDQGRERYLSEVVLDGEQGGGSVSRRLSLSDPVLELLRKHVHRRFGVDITEPRQRRDAFFLCRNSLLQGKVGSYVEQYQGLHSLMRGLAAALLLAFLYYLGWLLAAGMAPGSGAENGHYNLGWAALIAFLPAALGHFGERGASWVSKRLGRPARGATKSTSQSETRISSRAVSVEGIRRGLRLVADQMSFVVVAAGLFVIARFAGSWYQISGVQAFILAALASLFLVSFVRFRAAAKAFDESLAKAVYHDFVVLATGEKEG